MIISSYIYISIIINYERKLITKSFERLLEKGLHRGFITYDELGKSLGKRGKSTRKFRKAIIIIFDNKISLVQKKVRLSIS